MRGRWVLVNGASLHELTSLVPASRFGALLSQTRTRLGMTLSGLATHSGGRFDIDHLRAAERGRLRASELSVARLCVLYGIGARQLPSLTAWTVALEPDVAPAPAVQSRSVGVAALAAALSDGPQFSPRDWAASAIWYLDELLDLRLFDARWPRRFERDAVVALGLGPLEIPAFVKVKRREDPHAWADRRRQLAARLFVPAAGIQLGRLGGGSLVLRPSGASEGSPTLSMPSNVSVRDWRLDLDARQDPRHVSRHA